MAVAKEWFTVEEAAEYLCVSRRTVYKLIHDGRLPAYLIGQKRHRRFNREDLDRVPQARIGSQSTNAATTLSAFTDPVLAELWDNKKDAIYDKV
ncbi:MAG: helix-turn-helix domain-containing protein [Chloroflexi bacterium]|nr:helix-turn-helix domain-containing protein [Chloroflexota bacterium]